MKLVMVLCLGVLAVGCGDARGADGDSTVTADVLVNEAMAVAHLRCLAAAQTQASVLGVIDTNENGVGEHGFLAELAGSRTPRGPGKGLRVELLSDAFGELSDDGIPEIDGYRFQVFLPGVDGAAVSASDVDSTVDVLMAERAWVAYAWPVKYEETGVRTFVVLADGAVHSIDLPGYSGADAPAGTAALAPGEAFGRGVRPEWQRVD